MDVIQKANKRIYFLILLKRANAPAQDIICFCYLYKASFRILCPPYHHALPDNLSKDIGCIKKRALSIISPGLSYDDSL